MADDSESRPVRTGAVFFGEQSYAELLEGIGPARAAHSKDEPQDIRDYLGGRAAKWLIERVDRAKREQRFENALSAITQHLSKQMRESGMDLTGPIAGFACLATSTGRSGGRKSFEKLAALGTGKTWKALAEFPERLRRIAKEVEQVNKSLFFAPALYVNAKTTQAEIVRKRFEQLPGIMSFYATGMEVHIARTPKLWAKTFPPSQGRHSPWLLLLSYAVKLATGKWHDAEVAELLNATAVALDETREFDALTIAQARSRFKKKKT